MADYATDIIRRYADPAFCSEREFLLEGETIIRQARMIRAQAYLAYRKDRTAATRDVYDHAIASVELLRDRQRRFDRATNRDLDRFQNTAIQVIVSVNPSILTPPVMEPRTLITYLAQQFGEQHRDLLNTISHPEHQRALQEATNLYKGAISNDSDHQAVNAAALRRYVDRTIMSTPLEQEVDLNSGIALRGIVHLLLTDILQRERDRPVQ